MIRRVDVIGKEREIYPQYYKGKYFGPDPDGRFVRWDDLPWLVRLSIKVCNILFEAL